MNVLKTKGLDMTDEELQDKLRYTYLNSNYDVINIDVLLMKLFYWVPPIPTSFYSKADELKFWLAYKEVDDYTWNYANLDFASDSE